MNNNPFNILGQENNSKAKIYDGERKGKIDEQIKLMVSSNPVFLFMKGTPQFPQCGFSANVVAILNNANVEYSTFDVLSDMDIRQGIKEFSNWPTIPQLYINGEFIGGCDIITELFEKGELKDILPN